MFRDSTAGRRAQEVLYNRDWAASSSIIIDKIIGVRSIYSVFVLCTKYYGQMYNVPLNTY